MNNCEGVSSQHEIVSQYPSKNEVDVVVVVIDMHHTFGYHLDVSLEGMLSLIDISRIVQQNKQTSS